jgi:hypothetical protein
MSGAKYGPEKMFEVNSDILAAPRVSLEEGLGKAKPSRLLLHSRIALFDIMDTLATENGRAPF